jgi:pimeloyl-ACP methyl ester carboxylesterase
MNDFVLPETRYAESGDVNIAYQVIGDGPIDIILVPGVISHVEFTHEIPGYTAFLRRLSSFARVVTFDKRGQGLSDRMTGAPSLEQRMDDVRAIMDTIGSQRAVLMGFSEGCPMSALFAVTYPERVSHLILFAGFACAADRMHEKAWSARVEHVIKHWGTGQAIKTVTPSQANDPAAIAQFAKFERLSSSPGALKTIFLLNRQIDVTAILHTPAGPNSRAPPSRRSSGSDRIGTQDGGRHPRRQIPGISRR